MDNLGKFLVTAGLGVAALGALIWLMPSSLKLGKLPGDIHIQRDGFSFFMPITTMLLISGVLTLVLWLASILRR